MKTISNKFIGLFMAIVVATVALVILTTSPQQAQAAFEPNFEPKVFTGTIQASDNYYATATVYENDECKGKDIHRFHLQYQILEDSDFYVDGEGSLNFHTADNKKIKIAISQDKFENWHYTFDENHYGRGSSGKFVKMGGLGRAIYAQYQRPPFSL